MQGPRSDRIWSGTESGYVNARCLSDQTKLYFAKYGYIEGGLAIPNDLAILNTPLFMINTDNMAGLYDKYL